MLNKYLWESCIHSANILMPKLSILQDLEPTVMQGLCLSGPPILHVADGEVSLRS
jgi:hypothetical protein